MKITIEIPDEEIKESIKKAVVDRIIKENSWGSGRMFRKEFETIIKEMIYDPETKKDIIDKATSKAADEIRKKGMPLFMQKMTGTSNDE